MNHYLKDCTGIILAGGENSRMPVLKAFIEVGGEKIIERNLRMLKGLFQENFIVTNQPEYYVHLGVPMLGDVYDIRGPMSGIFTSLLNASHHWVFIAACDMPFINEDLVKYMAFMRGKYSAVVPRTDGKTEPLFGFYSTKLLTSMEKVLLSGKRSLKDFLLIHSKRVKYITKEELDKIDPEMRSFINLNTPAEVKRYLQPKDRSKFDMRVKRRNKCSGLEQLN